MCVCVCVCVCVYISPKSKCISSYQQRLWLLGWLGGGGLVAKLCLTLGTPWILARQTPLSMGFSRQEYRTGLPFPSLGDLPIPEIEPRSPTLQANSLPTEL